LAKTSWWSLKRLSDRFQEAVEGAAASGGLLQIAERDPDEREFLFRNSIGGPT
jgi:hypothetical protein